MSRRIAVSCALALGALAAAPAGAQVFAGPEFRMNAYTTGDQTFPTVSIDPAGDFRAVWSALRVRHHGCGGGPAVLRGRDAARRRPLRKQRHLGCPRPQRRHRRGGGRRRQLHRRLGQRRAGRLATGGSSASATPAPARPSAPSSTSTPTRRDPRATSSRRIGVARTPAATSSSSGRASQAYRDLRDVFGQRYATPAAPSVRVPRQHVHHERAVPPRRGLGRLRQLRRGLGEQLPGRLGLRRLRPALRQLRRAPRPRVPRQHDDRGPAEWRAVLRRVGRAGSWRRVRGGVGELFPERGDGRLRPALRRGGRSRGRRVSRQRGDAPAGVGLDGGHGRPGQLRRGLDDDLQLITGP